MKKTIALLGFALATGLVSSSRAETAISLEPFEPVSPEPYSRTDKFAEPTAVYLAEPLYPTEMRRSSISGEVVVLVQIDTHGVPSRLSVLSTTHHLFSRYAVAALLQSTWHPPVADGKPKPVWFYRRIVFDVTRE